MKTKKTTFDIRHSTFERQEGVTIIIAIILLATISFISFSLSTLILRGIQFARVLQNSELALSGANSGGEISIFRFQRNAGSISVTNSPLANGALFDVYPNLTTFSYTDAVLSGVQSIINLYDANNINVTDPGFRSVKITNTGSPAIKADVFSWSDSTTNLCSFNNITSGNFRTCALGADRYQIIVQLQGGGSQSSVSVEGFDSGGAPIGIATQDPTIEIVGKTSDVQRRIRVDL